MLDLAIPTIYPFLKIFHNLILNKGAYAFFPHKIAYETSIFSVTHLYVFFLNLQLHSACINQLNKSS